MTQVTWTKERRLILNGIIQDLVPDVYPNKRFCFYPGPQLLHQASLMDTRRFQIFTGPSASGGVGRVGSYAGDMMHNYESYFRLDIKYIGNTGLGDFIMDCNDMVHSDIDKILWAINPQYGPASTKWGVYAPVKINLVNQVATEMPGEELLEAKKPPWIIWRFFFLMVYNVGPTAIE